MNALPLNVIVLYDAHSTFTQTVLEHLRSFPAFSGHRVFFAHATHETRSPTGLEAFDVVAIHYSVRVAFSWMSSFYVEQLLKFRGVKVLFIQDEYDHTETAREWIERLGIDVVFTCVPPPYVDAVYPRSRFPKTEFVSTLTGFVPPRFENGEPRVPIASRKVVVGYRGRPLPYWYGKLAREKLVIGQQMKKVCDARGLVSDIEWTEAGRIYGEGWYDWLSGCKATLGSESGSNVFDERGEIRSSMKSALAKNPALTFEEAFERLVAPHEGTVAQMNQVSPRVFEAIALGTALVLYEGTYSGVVQPGVHFVPLKKDLSNIDEVVEALRDDARLQAMADRAYQDVIASGRWSYRNAVGELDAAIARHVRARVSASPFTVVLGAQRTGAGDPRVARLGMRQRLRDLVTSAPLVGEQVNADVGYVPLWIRMARKVWVALGLGAVLDVVRGNR